jgi:adenylosuccinate lyase
VWLPKARTLIETISTLAEKYKDSAMLSRTHGQPATPTTMGKELAIFVHRLTRQVTRIENAEYLGKFSGATGTWSAHVVAAPEVDWVNESKAFVESLGLKFNPLTTQIESHDWQAELYSAITLFNRILHNLCTDMWTYISMNYFKQIPVAGATGSSTMPHKVNPIRFENAEANLELSNAVLDSLSSTLVTSRMQRDLTDSSAQRNIGLGFGHSLLAIDNTIRGLGEVELSTAVLESDLAENWEVLAEAIQTVIRAEVAAGRSDITDPYQLLKDLTRGRRIGSEDLALFVQGLNIGQDAKDRLLMLKPTTYTGLASELVLIISKK